MTKRRKFTAEFKAKIGLEALRGDRTIQEIASCHQVRPNQVSTWKRQAMDGLGEVFSNGADQERRDHDAEVHGLHAKIGQLTVERDFVAQTMSRAERKAMIRHGVPGLSLSRQCEILSNSRSSLITSRRARARRT